MAQRTLLSITQSILQSMGRGMVDSIEETDDSLQVAQIVRDTYYEGLANRNWPHKFELTSLSPLGLSTPTHFIIPTDIKSIEWVKYNKIAEGETRKRYEEVTYRDPLSFIDFVMHRDSSAADVVTVTDTGGTELFIKNGKAPEYWTSFDQVNMVMDSYDSAVDSALQESKTQVYGPKTATFSLLDTHVPDIPEHAFPWLLEESKSVAFVEITQEGNAKAEQKARRNGQWLSRNSRKSGKGYSLPSFGRTSRK